MSGSRFDLGGRTVLVTGASSGLGARFARVLADAGAVVAIAARRTAMLDALANDIRAAGGRVFPVAIDVTDEASIITGYDRIEAEFGGIDSVIVNAGMNIEGSALDIAIDDFDRIHAVNVRGAFLTAREAARRMIEAGSSERGHGRLVFISSITATSISPGIAPYSGSKAAILQIARVLARDWANKGICVNSILPGYVETDLNASWFATEGGRKHIAKWPRRRLMNEGALDTMLLYLASDAAAEVTGAAFTIDDGQSMAS